MRELFDFLGKLSFFKGFLYSTSRVIKFLGKVWCFDAIFFSHLLVVPSKVSANLYHEGYKCLDKARPMALLILR